MLRSCIFAAYYRDKYLTIPDWNMAGIIPPVRPGGDPAGVDRSPYRVNLEQLIAKFCTSTERAEILQGLLNYRMALYGLGITTGFQWVDGSFVENIEDLEARAPNDVDVVSYIVLPAGQTQATLFPTLRPLQDRANTKATYKVDAFIRVAPQVTIRDVCYWYSLWSHRRDGLWKGFAEVDLDPTADVAAQANLTQAIAAGFT